MNFLEKAPAKLNLSLNLTGETKDNYHFIVSLIAFLDLQDMLTVERSDRFSYEISGTKKDFGKDDLVMKSLKAILKKKKIEKLPAVKIVLDKKIPIGAGLGGGSADAAATIRLFNRYMRLNMSLEEMTNIASEIGSDVPSCLVSEPLILSGYGENIVKIPYFPDIEILLIYPNLNIVTKEVFDQIDMNKIQKKKPYYYEELLQSQCNLLEKGKLEGLNLFTNDLQSYSVILNPRIKEVIKVLEDSGSLFSRMTGSGSACFGIFPEVKIDFAEKQIKFFYADWFVRKCKLIGTNN